MAENTLEISYEAFFLQKLHGKYLVIYNNNNNFALLNKAKSNIQHTYNLVS